jgi:hypothetical protein
MSKTDLGPNNNAKRRSFGARRPYRVNGLGVISVAIIPFLHYFGSMLVGRARGHSYFFGAGVLSDPLPASRV